MSSPVRFPLGSLTRQSADESLVGDYFLHALAGDTSISGSIPGRRLITYNGGALAITLGAPVAGQDDGNLLEILSITAQAHTITCTGKLFDGAGHSNTLTFAAQKGVCAILEAYQGNWYTRSLNGVTGS